MPEKLKILNLSIPQSFEPVKKEADKLVEKDPKFKDSLSGMNNRYNKKNNHNKLNSVKMRFYIAYYLTQRKKELKKQGGENVKRSESDNTEKENFE